MGFLNNFIKLKYKFNLRVLRCFLVFLSLSLLCSFDFFKSKPTSTEITGLEISGSLNQENILINLQFEVQAGTDQKKLLLFEGEYALVHHTLGDKGELEVHENKLCVNFTEKGKHKFQVSLAVSKIQKGATLISSFKIPDYKIRPVKFNSGKDEIDLNLHSLLKTERTKNKAGDWVYSGFMKLGEEFKISWQPKVEKLEKELSMICTKHSVVSVGVGSLKVDSLYEYQIVQGTASQLLLKVPEGINVSRVYSKTPIRNWQIIKKADQRLLEINLRNKSSNNIRLKIESEYLLSSLPSQVHIKFIEPQQVLRVSGFVALGTNSALKILVGKAMGLSQVEAVSFNKEIRKNFSKFPVRSLFVYNFAAMPLNLEIKVDKIQPVIFTDSQLSYNISESSLQLRARVETEVRDSGLRELNFLFDKRLSLANIAAANVKDYEVFEEEGQKRLAVYFRQSVLGKRLIDLTFEWSHKGWENSEKIPELTLPEARTARGFISFSGTDGLLLDISKQEKLRQVPVASLPIRSTQIQSAWRFKDADWTGELTVKKKKSSLYSELFHLYSLGENVIYGSVSITTHISGAPIDQLKIKVPENYKNLELVGRHRPRLYKSDGNEWQVKLQNKINGDYTLLLTFEVNQSTADSEFVVGGVELPESDSESGFITVSGPTGIKATTLSVSNGLLEVETDQVPAAYKLLHSHPVHLAYKYVSSPHLATITLKSYDQVNLLDLVIEHSKMVTKVNANGERVTEVECWVKNSSRQHLSLQLPESSKFWSCSVDGNQVRCTNKGDLLQVPVPRNSDPNKTIHVKYSYAESGSELKDGQLFEMNSPEYSVPGVFNEWQVQFPAGYSILKQQGSMDVTEERVLNSRLDILEVMENFYKWSSKHAIQQVLIFTFGLLIMVVCWQIKQVKVFGLVLGVILVLTSSAQLISKKPAPVTSMSEPSYQVMNFKKTVSAANEVQKISGVVKDNSLQVTGESKPGIVYFVLAFLSLLALVKFQNFLPVFGSLVFTWIGCLGNSQAEYYFAILLSLLRPIVFTMALGRFISSAVSRVSFRNVSTVATLLLLSFTVPDIKAEDKVEEVYSKVDYAGYEIVSGDKTARINAVFKLVGKKGERFLLLKSPCALLKTEFDEKYLKLLTENGQCIFELTKASKQTVQINFEVPVNQNKEEVQLCFYKPISNKHETNLFISGDIEKEIKSLGSLYFSKSIAGNHASALFRNNAAVHFTWKDKEKKISDIPSVFFAETSSLCLAGDGSYDLEHKIALKISRGQVNKLAFIIPKNQTVTSVSADGLSNWAFDPKRNQLEMIFLKGIQGRKNLVINSQIQNPSLEKELSVSVPKLSGGTRQYGMIAFGSREGLKINLRQKTEVQEIDAVDFPIRTFSLHKNRQPESALYSFSYMKLPMSLTLHASRVEAEIETQIKADLSIGDERLVLSNRLQVEIKKAGVFEMRLNLPNDYEIESLTSNEISHWDEINNQGQRQIILYFKNRVKGKVTGNLVLVKNAERKASEIVVPKITVVGEKRHKGTLLVSAERGNRLEVAEKEGIGRVVLMNEGSMSMSLLRKEWSLKLIREVLNSRIEVEALESMEFADTHYKVQGRAIVNVENAGTKFLTLKGNQQIQNLEIRGKDIARTEKLGAGTWQVEFKRKIFGEHRLNYQYQTYYDSSQQVQLSGVQFIDAERQRGFLCMKVPAYMSGNISATDDLQAFEPRLLPKNLADLQDKKSTFCFRVLASQWSCDVAFIRHSKASILEANVQDVSIETMVALDGRQLNVVNISISSGSKNFLQMKLPGQSHLCSVFSNNEPLKVTAVGDQLMIPLNQSMPGESSRRLQVIYITDKSGFDWQKANFDGPQFDLPLKEVNWNLYVPNEKKYDEFTGSMKFIPEAYYFTNSIDNYLKKNKADQQMSREQANVLLEQAYEWSNSGRRDLARKNYEAVVSLSDSMSDINEDARIQLQATLRQQTLVGLVNRRANLKANSSGEVYQFDELSYNDGHFSDSFAKAVEKTLEKDESRMLSKVSDKIMSQQAAASRQVMPLKLTLPKEGRQLRFYRQVQIQPMVPMNVSFEAVEEPRKVAAADKSTKQNILIIVILLVGSLLMMGVSIKK